MILTDKQRNDMEQAAKPLIEWLRQLKHPHCAVLIDVNSAELVEGIARIKIPWEDGGYGE